jgi:hypothetical protein
MESVGGGGGAMVKSKNSMPSLSEEAEGVEIILNF